LDRLQDYQRKRDFEKTPEPSGRTRRKTRARKALDRWPRFVIQKHDATRLHYDFRLEAEGVLLSWAVPKGPSLNPADRRLAMQTEDHPLSYAAFEGVIPEGEYGGGPVIVWDQGRYVNLTHAGSRRIGVTEGLKRGHLKFWLAGQKIRGGFTLTRLSGAEDKRAWLLVKLHDAEAKDQEGPVADRPESVVTGRTLTDLYRKAPKTRRQAA
jgi:DNA ligase D-like protein (predicted 3'-phosphoesterase)